MTETASGTPRPAPAPGDLDQEWILRRIPLEILLAALVLAVPAGLVFGLRPALFFLAGGALSALGFSWLKQSLARFLHRGRRGALRSGLLLYLARLLLICGVFLAIILTFPGEILAFGAGFSMLIPVFLYEGARALFLMRTWKT